MTGREKLENVVAKYGFGISVQKLAEEVYHELRADDVKCAICNDRYITIYEGDAKNTYQMRKTRSKGHWTVVEF